MSALAIKSVFSTTCKCFTCRNPECNMLSYSDDIYSAPTCECGEPESMEPSNACYGCYEDEKDYWVDTLFPEWLHAKGEPTYLKVSGRNVGWNHRSGYDKVKADFKSLFDYLTFNGEWTLSFKLESNDLTVVRSSHDEYAAHYTIEPLRILQDTMDFDTAIQLGLVDEYGCNLKCGEYFYDCDCEVE